MDVHFLANSVSNTINLPELWIQMFQGSLALIGLRWYLSIHTPTFTSVA